MHEWWEWLALVMGATESRRGRRGKRDGGAVVVYWQNIYGHDGLLAGCMTWPCMERLRSWIGDAPPQGSQLSRHASAHHTIK